MNKKSSFYRHFPGLDPIVLVLLFVALVQLTVGQDLANSSPDKVGIDAERLTRLTTTLDKYAADGRLAGGVVKVSRKDKVVLTHAFGLRDVESRSPMKDDSIFRIASQTKAIVSVGIMILQDEGKLLITDPAGKYIPEFANTTVAVPKDGGGYDVVKAKRQITIRDLLTHTSGFGYGGGISKDKWEAAGITGWYFAGRDEPIAATIARMAALPAESHPGEKFVYGYSTDILGVVIEKASGMPLDEFLRVKIFEPLGMKDTHFFLPESKLNRLATVYSTKPDNTGITRTPDTDGMVGQGAYVKGPRKSFSGGAGLLSTAEDYMRFLTMIHGGGKFGSKRILSRKSIELMIVDHLGAKATTPGAGFGLGFSVVENLGLRGAVGSEGEYGWGGAYHSNYWVDPKEELVVVYFTQLIPAGNIDDFGKLRALIYQALQD